MYKHEDEDFNDKMIVFLIVVILGAALYLGFYIGLKEGCGPAYMDGFQDALSNYCKQRGSYGHWFS